MWIVVRHLMHAHTFYFAIDLLLNRPVFVLHHQVRIVAM